MGVAKRMFSKVRQGAPWRGHGGTDLLGGVGVSPDGTLFLKVSPAPPATATTTPVPPVPRHRRPGTLESRVLV